MSERPTSSQPRPPHAHPRKRIGHNGVSSARALSAHQIIYRKTFSKVSECCSRHILQSCPRSVLKEHQCELEVSTAKLLSRCPFWCPSGMSGPIFSFMIPSAMTTYSQLYQLQEILEDLSEAEHWTRHLFIEKLFLHAARCHATE